MTGPLCEMFCDEPLDAAARPPLAGWKNTCSACERQLKWVCSVFLPSVRRHGYWAPADATPEQELAAVVGQAGMRSQMHDVLHGLDVPLTDGRQLSDLFMPGEQEERPS